MLIATRWSRSRLRGFWRPEAVLSRMCWPSCSIHTGVTCGAPSGIRVTKWPRFGSSISWRTAGVRSAMLVAPLLRAALPRVRVPLYDRRVRECLAGGAGREVLLFSSDAVSAPDPRLHGAGAVGLGDL